MNAPGYLVKKATTTTKPGQQGIPYVPAQPARPGYYITVWQKVIVCMDTGAEAEKAARYRPVIYIDLTKEDAFKDSITIDTDSHRACEWPWTCHHEIEKSNTACSARQIQSTGAKRVTVWVPPFPGVPGQAFKAGTAAQISKNLNEGWNNSCSSSISPVNTGQYIKFFVANGVRGVLVALGEDGSSLQKFSAYKHALILSKDGAVVFENGLAKVKLAESFTSDYEFRIYRKKNGVIVYSYIYKNREVSFSSKSSLNETRSIHAYAVLYRAGDSILSAAIKNYFEYKSAPEIEIRQKLISISGAEVKTAILQCVTSESKSIRHVRIAQKISSNSNSNGRVVLNANIGKMLASLCSGPFKTRLNAKLKFAKPYIEDAPYVPPDLEGVYSNFPTILAKFHAVATRSSRLSASFFGMWFKSIREGRSFLTASFPEMVANIGQAIDGYAFMHATLSTGTSHSLLIDRVIGLVAVLSVEDSSAVSRESIAAILSSIGVSDICSAGIERLASIESEICVDSFVSSTVNNLPDLSGGPAWVINIESGAVTLFKDYGFNSICKLNGESYGVANDGIYKLTNNESPASQSYIDFGNLNSQTFKKKRIPNWYASMSSSGKVFLKLNVDGRSFVYEFRSSGTSVENRRVDVGKGLLSVFYNPIIIAPEGVSIDELNSLTFDPIAFERKI